MHNFKRIGGEVVIQTAITGVYLKKNGTKSLSISRDTCDCLNSYTYIYLHCHWAIFHLKEGKGDIL